MDTDKIVAAILAAGYAASRNGDINESGVYSSYRNILGAVQGEQEEAANQESPPAFSGPDADSLPEWGASL